MPKCVAVTLAFFSLTYLSLAGDTPVAATPPMGWNSWDCYGTGVIEAQVKANADAMARSLAKYGWQYVVVDIQWYEPAARGHNYKPGAALTMDEYGRLTPALNRFPSAANGVGFRALADYVHGKGLKFGIHIMRGIPRQAVVKNTPVDGTPYRASDIADMENTCTWNPDMVGVDTTKPGSQAYYDSIARLYASWGVDFIKADDMGSHLYQPAEIRALSLALRKTGRPMVLSISPGPAPVTEAAFFQKYATMWRISDDFWDQWKLLRQQFEFMREWERDIGKNGTWPDADMLPLGRLRVTDDNGRGTPTKFTPDEQRTVMTLWSIFRSPLIFGGDLASIDPFTLSLLTNAEVIAVDQHSSGNRESFRRGNFIVWTANAPDDGVWYAAVFNAGERADTLTASWDEVGIPGKEFTVRDLWELRDIGKEFRLEVTLRPHASVLYRLSRQERPSGSPRSRRRATRGSPLRIK